MWRQQVGEGRIALVAGSNLDRGALVTPGSRS
jgi:hypothetical protein